MRRRQGFYFSLVALCVGLQIPCAGWGNPSGLKLDAVLDEHNYLVGEPIYALISVTNLTNAVFEDMAPLSPGEGWLELDLRETGTERKLAFTGNHIDAIYPWSGPSLQVGREVVLPTNLLLWFGVPGGEGKLTRCLDSRALPPGKYRLTLRFHARLHPLGGDDPIVISRPIEFEIVPSQAYPNEEVRARRFVERCPDPSDRRSINSYCYESLPQFYGSRYFTLIYSNIGPAADIPLASLLDVLDRYDRNAVRRAWLINLRCKVDRMSPQEKLARIRTLKASHQDEFSRRVLEYWENKMASLAAQRPETRPR